ncbi:MAG: amidohydrolase [Acidimicrobiales bacterium]|nr:amidohydrolase [Acidimicrobiales bacterium]MYG61982.1 amidohydrolase [Acidimicrobiales bacterium]MYJ47801.1 amidohydrolase [Acidimicrobiales bacterium]
MIIDCHGHYTTAPQQLGEYRDAQRAALQSDPVHVGAKGVLDISDDEIRNSIEQNQLRLQRERGSDLTIFSPRASWMGHHEGNEHTSRFWSEHCNDLIRRVCDLFPGNFVPVCQLPQSPGVPIDSSVRELRRCVEEMGFIGCNVSPDPSGGYWTGPPLSDPYWWPLWDAMAELDVPGMIHVSGSCNPNFHATSSHYLGADTTAFVQMMMSDLFADHPGLRLVIPHGGGAVPYHWGRFRGMAQDMGLRPLDESLLGNVYFDTCVYHQPGIDTLVEVIPPQNILFASEMVGAVRGIDPTTGSNYDDTKRYIDAADISDDARRMIFSENALRVYPRLAGALEAQKSAAAAADREG